MRRVLCPELPKPERPVAIPEAEATHLTRVLRLSVGDEIEVIDGRGGACTARLALRGKQWMATLSESTPEKRTSHDLEVVPVILEVAVLKGEAMEWVVEKAVELGARSLHPFISANTVVQTGRKSPEEFRDRWQKIADQALKQCGRLEKLEILPPRSLESLLTPVPPGEVRFWCDEASRGAAPGLLEAISDPAHQRPALARLLVGPEGGWNPKEIGLLEASSRRVSLGPVVLRAETAALAGLALLAAAYRPGSRLG